MQRVVCYRNGDGEVRVYAAVYAPSQEREATMDCAQRRGKYQAVHVIDADMHAKRTGLEVIMSERAEDWKDCKSAKKPAAVHCPSEFEDIVAAFRAAYGRVLTLAAARLSKAEDHDRHEIRDRVRQALSGRGEGDVRDIVEASWKASGLVTATKQASNGNRTVATAVVDTARQLRAAVEGEWMVDIPIAGAGL